MYMTATRALMAGILKLFILPEILPVYLIDTVVYVS